LQFGGFGFGLMLLARYLVQSSGQPFNVSNDGGNFRVNDAMIFLYSPPRPESSQTFGE